MRSRIKYCIANWKMYIHSNEIKHFIDTFNNQNFNSNTEVVLCPNFIDLMLASSLISKNSNIKLGSQDVSCFSHGAYTGDVSLNMIKSINCEYAIIGHSERRLYHDETNSKINEKLKILNNSSITPIICIGETLEEKNLGKTFNIIESQLNEIFDGVDVLSNKKYLIAYEPRWAIGTGIAADIKTIHSVYNYIKNIIETIDKKYRNLYLLYGGSVNEKNASEILNVENIDGFLIGSSSIKPNQFYKIYNKF